MKKAKDYTPAQITRRRELWDVVDALRSSADGGKKYSADTADCEGFIKAISKLPIEQQMAFVTFAAKLNTYVVATPAIAKWTAKNAKQIRKHIRPRHLMPGFK